jgi:hypothetical protein
MPRQDKDKRKGLGFRVEGLEDRGVTYRQCPDRTKTSVKVVSASCEPGSSAVDILCMGELPLSSNCSAPSCCCVCLVDTAVGCPMNVSVLPPSSIDTCSAHY